MLFMKIQIFYFKYTTKYFKSFERQNWSFLFKIYKYYIKPTEIC